MLIIYDMMLHNDTMFIYSLKFCNFNVYDTHVVYMCLQSCQGTYQSHNYLLVAGVSELVCCVSRFAVHSTITADSGSSLGSSVLPNILAVFVLCFPISSTSPKHGSTFCFYAFDSVFVFFLPSSLSLFFSSFLPSSIYKIT